MRLSSGAIVCPAAVPDDVCDELLEFILDHQDRASDRMGMGAQRTRADLPVPFRVLQAVQAAAREATGCPDACVSSSAHCYVTVGPGDVYEHTDRQFIHGAGTGCCSDEHGGDVRKWVYSSYTLLLYCNSTSSGSTRLVRDRIDVLPTRGTVLLMPRALLHGAQAFTPTDAEPWKVVALFRVWKV